MKQIIQSARTGKLERVEVPAPTPEPGQVLVRTAFSVVSPGTEKMAIEFARTSLLGKARKRPDLVRQVSRKLRQEGPLATYRTVMSRLDAPQPLGYSCAGVVEAVGEAVHGFAPGDRVACAGAGYANHAEFNVVPENLLARVPEDVPLERAAYATVGAIALQGLRLAEPQLGEVAVVIGLGLIGQLTVQLLRANGCRILGIDTAPARVKQGLDAGADWAFRPEDLPEDWKDRATGGHGADLALVTASANSSAPITLAADLCRTRGRLSVVGAMPMDLERRSFYDKELSLQVSMSYGPGRYDRRYEELGLDYPLAHVRWTENRNMQAFLALLEAGAVRPDRLDTEIVDFDQAEKTYEELASGARRSLSIVLRYGEQAPADRTLTLREAREPKRQDDVGVAFVGAGNYAKAMLLPALGRCGRLRRQHLVTATGPSGVASAKRFGFAACGTNPTAALTDPTVDLVFVATRHDSHASLACQALREGKAVWLEKPVGLSPEEVDQVLRAAAETEGFLTVGYNRRFSSHARAVRDAFADRQGPLAIHYVVAAGPPPTGSWIVDPAVGGGRIVGELCHFIDLCSFWVGSPPRSVYARALGREPERDDSTVVMLHFPDGSTATTEYLAGASRELPKERFEISGGGRTAQGENFHITRLPNGRRIRTVKPDKGQSTAVAEVVAAVRAGGPAPFTLAELAAVSRATFAVQRSLETGRAEEITPWPR